MKKIIIIFLLIFGRAAINAQNENFDWLIGEWVYQNEYSRTVEIWSKISPFTIEGESFTLTNEGDSVLFSESLRIVRMDGQYFYIVKVPGNELPIPFKLTEVTDSSFQFENKMHDFPQKIKYIKISNDSVRITISKMNNDGLRSFFFIKEDLE